YCGIYSQNNPLTKEKLEKADIIFTMEESQRTFIAENFPTEYLQKKIINLDIPDIYSYNDPKLIKILKSIVTP
ncbi:MAG: phosphotyrosine protein phosphatase, partial [Candidatus Nanoarchaeia archaeon]|nr:phosphotyrosine protein phosphatase [Candidatus Nanoarchaeia archaeon]